MPKQVLTQEQEAEIPALYDAGATMPQLIARYGCSRTPIERVLRQAGAEGTLRRPPHGARTTAARKDATAIVEGYAAGLSRRALAEKHNHPRQAINAVLREAGVPIRNDRLRSGPQSPSWNGGRNIGNEGYVKVWIPPDHPFASMADGRSRVLEHRLVMAEHLGRPLFPYERVHHLNGIRDDNRVGNLELWEESHPPGQRNGEGVAPHCPTCTCHQPSSRSL